MFGWRLAPVPGYSATLSLFDAFSKAEELNASIYLKVRLRREGSDVRAHVALSSGATLADCDIALRLYRVAAARPADTDDAHRGEIRFIDRAKMLGSIDARPLISVDIRCDPERFDRIVDLLRAGLAPIFHVRMPEPNSSLTYQDGRPGPRHSWNNIDSPTIPIREFCADFELLQFEDDDSREDTDESPEEPQMPPSSARDDLRDAFQVLAQKLSAIGESLQAGQRSIASRLAVIISLVILGLIAMSVFRR